MTTENENTESTPARSKVGCSDLLASVIPARERDKLSEKLKYWRAERPDEWTMDEFIRDAQKMETAITAAHKFFH